MLRGTPGTTWTHGRRCALIGASAAVVCLGGVLAACGGGGGGDGYVAVGAPGGQGRSSATAVAPTGEVTLVPLDAPTGAAGPGSGAAGDSPGRYGDRRYEDQQPASPEETSPEDASPGEPSPEGTERPAHRTSDQPGPAGTPADSAAPPTSSPAPSAPPTAAKLTVSDPEREPADRRWCEKVTLVFRNSGGTTVRSGTVTFGTHIIGALGIDWATVESTEQLPAPIGAGARKEKTWTVCVDAWRVPLGMHVETRDVDVRWE